MKRSNLLILWIGLIICALCFMPDLIELMFYFVSQGSEIVIDGIITNRIISVFFWGLTSLIISKAIYKKIISTKELGRYYLIFGVTHIILSILMPRFEGYFRNPKDTELFASTTFTLLDGELFLRGIIIVILSVVVKNCLVVIVKPKELD